MAPRWPGLEVPGQPAGVLVGREPHPALAMLLGALQLANQPYFTLVYI